jgi:hypothetical protein
MKSLVSSGAVCTILLLGFPSRADAYLDPATGSIVLQVVMGGILAALAATKLYWNRLRLLFRRDKKQ